MGNLKRWPNDRGESLGAFARRSMDDDRQRLLGINDDQWQRIETLSEQYREAVDAIRILRAALKFYAPKHPLDQGRRAADALSATAEWERRRPGA